MDIVREPKIQWLNYKWIFICLSLLLSFLGAASLVTRAMPRWESGMGPVQGVIFGLNLGVDFTGGTLVYVKFAQTPELERVRRSLTEGGLRPEEVTRFDDESKNQLQIRMAQIETDKADNLTAQSRTLFETLRQEFDSQKMGEGRLDLNNVSRSELIAKLREADSAAAPEDESLTETQQRYQEQADRLIGARTQLGGVFSDPSQLQDLDLEESVRKALDERFYLGSFSLLSVESVGPKVGQELADRAFWAVLFSLGGVLVYIGLRFQLVFGMAAIIALFHDVFITVGFFSLLHKEISLTVIAALLTLVGYSINDTIVIFDRVRENVREMRTKDLESVINLSINQTLNRTILTSGMTFLAVFALYLLGGQVLNGFSFALVVGIIIGTYSSIAIASPVVVWWQAYRENRKAGA